MIKPSPVKLNGFAGEGLCFRRKLWNCQKAKKLYRKQLEEKKRMKKENENAIKN